MVPSDTASQKRNKHLLNYVFSLSLRQLSQDEGQHYLKAREVKCSGAKLPQWWMQHDEIRLLSALWYSLHIAFIMFIWFSSPRDDLQHSQYFVLSMFIMFITSMKVFCTCLVLFRGHVAICFVSRTFARRCLLQPTTPGWTVRPWRSWRVRPLPRPSVGWWIVDVHPT